MPLMSSDVTVLLPDVKAMISRSPDPENAICDGPQALPTDRFRAYADRVRQAAALGGRARGDATLV